MPMLTIDDIGSYWWGQMFARSKHKCFDVK